MQVSWTWTDKLKSEDKEYTAVLKKNIVQCFGLHYTVFFFSTCHELKKWFLLSGVNYIEMI